MENNLKSSWRWGWGKHLAFIGIKIREQLISCQKKIKAREKAVEQYLQSTERKITIKQEFYTNENIF